MVERPVVECPEVEHVQSVDDVAGRGGRSQLWGCVVGDGCYWG